MTRLTMTTGVTYNTYQMTSQNNLIKAVLATDKEYPVRYPKILDKDLHSRDFNTMTEALDMGTTNEIARSEPCLMNNTVTYTIAPLAVMKTRLNFCLAQTD